MMSDERKTISHFIVHRSYFIVGLMALAVGCGSPQLVRHDVTPNDTPFGGGVPVNQHPDGDPFGREQRRQEYRLIYPAPYTQPPVSPAGGTSPQSAVPASALFDPLD